MTNQNPSMINASENMTFVLTGKYPETLLDKHKKIAEEISDLIEGEK